MDVSGKLIKVLPLQKGTSARGEWQKQEFVVEVINGSFPRNICFQVWNNKVNLESLSPNETIKVFFEIDSREFNDKWFTTLTAWRIESLQNQAPNMPTPPTTFQSAPLPDSVPENTFVGTNDEGDDLPF